MSIQADGFRNQQVDAEALPDYRQVELKPVARNFLPYSLITTAGFWLFLALLLLIVPRLPYMNFEIGLWPPVGLLVAAGWFCLITWLGVRKRAWALREHDLIYVSGVIWRKTVIVPFVRIQHVETSSGPLERWFGLTRLKCFTAGGMMADLTVEGLDTEAAGQVRQYLLEQIRDDRPVDEPADVAADEAVDVDDDNDVVSADTGGDDRGRG
jgi:membrane protein YdbS with pleckstrin-like domain